MKNNKVFLITIDTEGDNQWDNDNDIKTENAKYLKRFQELAEKYEFKPVWLSNYEMVSDDFFVAYFKEKQDKNLCEIGMHLHAWNNPPEYKLNKINKERDYLIEYPKEIMEEKIKNITNLIENKFGIKPVSHRSGRWTTNEEYFNLLEKYGYKIDCSITPHINWENNLGSTGIKGSNYENCEEKPYYINKILEIPMTIRKSHTLQKKRIKSIKNFLGELLRLVKGRYQWMRPDKYFSKEGYFDIINKCSKKNEYIMFMIHSSELMPNGSPNFKTEEDIDNLYIIIEEIFKYAKNHGYIGMTLKEYEELYRRTR